MEKSRLPCNEEIEKYVLSALLADNAVFEKVEGIVVNAEIFFFEQHRIIFSTIIDFLSKDRVSTVQTLSQVLNHECFDCYGGAENYLISLEKSFIGFLKIEEHAKYLAELYFKRKMIKLGEEMIYLSDIDKQHSIQDIVESVEKELSSISHANMKEACMTIREVMSMSIALITDQKTGSIKWCWYGVFRNLII